MTYKINTKSIDNLSNPNLLLNHGFQGLAFNKTITNNNIYRIASKWTLQAFGNNINVATVIQPTNTIFTNPTYPISDEISINELRVTNVLSQRFRISQLIEHPTLLSGKVVTVSLIIATNYANTITVGFSQNYGTGGLSYDKEENVKKSFVAIPTADGAYHKYNVSIAIQELKDYIILNGNHVEFFIESVGAGGASNDLYINSVKVEFGNKPTKITHKLKHQEEEELRTYYKDGIYNLMQRFSNNPNWGGTDLLYNHTTMTRTLPTLSVQNDTLAGAGWSVNDDNGANINTSYRQHPRLTRLWNGMTSVMTSEGHYAKAYTYYDADFIKQNYSTNSLTPQLNYSKDIKDISVIKYPNPVTGKEDIVVFGWKYVNSVQNFYGWYIDDEGGLVNEFNITYPAAPANYHRWAPCFRIFNGELHSYHSKGENADNNTMKLYHSKTALSGGTINHDWKGRIQSIAFNNETYFNVDSFGNWGGTADYKVIDPYVFEDTNGQLYIYYNIIFWGISGVRPYEEYIRVQRMSDPNTPYGQGDESFVYDGLANSVSDGVAEATQVFRNKNGTYVLIMSEMSSGWIDGTNPGELGGQYISLLTAPSPTGPWGNREVLFSWQNATYNTAGNPPILPLYPLDDRVKYGIGGQGIIQMDDKETYTMIAQGLSDDPSPAHLRQYNLLINTKQISEIINSK